MFSWLEGLISSIASSIGSVFEGIGETIVNAIWDSLMKWLFNTFYDSVADVFTQMGDMGAEIFDLSWIESTVRLFFLFGWVLFGVGVIGDLDDEQMQWLSQIGNDYRPISAYERGKRYLRRLHEFDGNVKSLAEAEGVDRNIISRCINTAGLPKDILAIFNHPGELSARAGDALFKAYQGQEAAMKNAASQLLRMKKSGESLDAQRIIQALHDFIIVEKNNSHGEKREKKYGDGVVAKYGKNFTTLKLDNRKIPSHLMSKIESILEEAFGNSSDVKNN